ncbi:hypothetical protein EYF80_012392 [Liparis tanakae]|uniref:Uncharacterized protein n=1 Tax=Liparis tanakae TaxID=230148 RepID=A0A4Z2IHV4_9TELE|nr:hypothetical protein EYF80_012392 [Liparis tanakae]
MPLNTAWLERLNSVSSVKEHSAVDDSRQEQWLLLPARRGGTPGLQSPLEPLSSAYLLLHGRLQLGSGRQLARVRRAAARLHRRWKTSAHRSHFTLRQRRRRCNEGSVNLGVHLPM